MRGPTSTSTAPFAAVVVCYGARPLTRWLEAAVDVDDRGFVIVDESTRRASLANVYAVGDCVAKPDAQRLASYAHFEGEFVATAIRATAHGAPTRPYDAPPRFVALSYGAGDGDFVYDSKRVPLPGVTIPLLKAAIESWFVRLLPMPYALLRLLPRLGGFSGRSS